MGVYELLGAHIVNSSLISGHKICLPGWDAIDSLAIAGGGSVPDEAGAEVGGSWALIKRSIVDSLSSSELGWLVRGLKDR